MKYLNKLLAVVCMCAMFAPIGELFVLYMFIYTYINIL